MKAVFDFITATISNKSCEHQYDRNKNNTNIHIAPKGSKLGVWVKVIIDFFLSPRIVFPCSNVETIGLTTK